MKTITTTLYTEAEFSERWPLYKTETVCIRKNCERHSEGLKVLPGWQVGQNFPSLYNDVIPATAEYFKQRIADLTGAIAHIEAHPEEL